MEVPILGQSSFGQFDANSGEFMPAKAQRIHDLIHEFDDTLYLQMIPERLRGPEDTKPYRIIQVHPEYEPYVVMNLAEDELDHRVLATLFDARDAVDKKDVNARLDSMEAAKELIKLKNIEEQQAEARDMATFMIRSPLHTINMNGKRFRV